MIVAVSATGFHAGPGRSAPPATPLLWKAPDIDAFSANGEVTDRKF
jgi:hypothetical protein